MNEYRWTDLSLGLSHEFQAVITPEHVDAFIVISGDRNPLHFDCQYAQDRGFQKNVVHGMLSSALYSTLVGIYLPGKFSLFQGIEIQFKRPVYPGQNLLVSGTIVHLNNAYRRVEMRASICNDLGEAVSKAKISVGVYE